MDSLTKLSLLDAVMAGKILFSSQPNLSDVALRKRVFRMREKNNFPMKKFGQTFYISLQRLEQWMEEEQV
tara:strand:+ start:2436 stop:2645 length:210 start_codon:yes stop_codon:yes gene_type:complete